MKLSIKKACEIDGNSDINAGAACLVLPNHPSQVQSILFVTLMYFTVKALQTCVFLAQKSRSTLDYYPSIIIMNMGLSG